MNFLKDLVTSHGVHNIEREMKMGNDDDYDIVPLTNDSDRDSDPLSPSVSSLPRTPAREPLTPSVEDKSVRSPVLADALKTLSVQLSTYDEIITDKWQLLNEFHELDARLRRLEALDAMIRSKPAVREVFEQEDYDVNLSLESIEHHYDTSDNLEQFDYSFMSEVSFSSIEDEPPLFFGIKPEKKGAFERTECTTFNFFPVSISQSNKSIDLDQQNKSNNMSETDYYRFEDFYPIDANKRHQSPIRERLLNNGYLDRIDEESLAINHDLSNDIMRILDRMITKTDRYSEYHNREKSEHRSSSSKNNNDKKKSSTTNWLSNGNENSKNKLKKFIKPLRSTAPRVQLPETPTAQSSILVPRKNNCGYYEKHPRGALKVRFADYDEVCEISDADEL
ncbi:hypothetical protein V1511DRAFT_488722 [Dipodascopsis uninucleata]